MLLGQGQGHRDSLPLKCIFKTILALLLGSKSSAKRSRSSAKRSRSKLSAKRSRSILRLNSHCPIIQRSKSRVQKGQSQVQKMSRSKLSAKRSRSKLRLY